MATPRQPGLFADWRARVAPAEETPPPPARDPASLSDTELIAAIPAARQADAAGLARETIRRRLSAAAPLFEALCRRFAGFGQDHAIAEQAAALEVLAALGGKDAVARLLHARAVRGPGRRQAFQAAALGCKVADAGGAIHKVPVDIPGVGRFSVVADPQGAAFVLFAPNMEMPNEPRDTAQPGHGGWRELRATDSAAALGFYADMFDWAQIDALDMGPMGLYRLFAGPGAKGPIGGIVTKTPDIPRPYWLYYFDTASIRAAAARIGEAGGQVVTPPMRVPGGGWILHALDPQGAMFALIAPAE